MRTITALIALWLWPAALGAQEVQQTPEGAHRFLALIGESQVTILNYSRYRWPAFSVQYQVKFARAGECQTQMSGAPLNYWDGKKWINAGTPKFDERLAGWLQYYKLPSPPVTIDWSKVSSVRLVDELVPNPSVTYPQRVILIAVNGGLWQLLLPDQVTAKRIQYAMAFLKESCDQTAETGF